MKFDLSEATLSVQAMVNGFIERLTYLAVALVVFFIFYFVGKAVRFGVRALATRNRRHYNLGLVMGRLSQGLLIFTVNTAYEKRRVQYDIGIGFGDDIARAKRVLLDTVPAIPEVLHDPAPRYWRKLPMP